MEPVQLVNLEGVIPTPHRGVVYHTPILIWLPRTFPEQPPAVFLVPSGGLFRDPAHRHVDADLRVLTPYLAGWNPRTSTLRRFVDDVCEVFGRYPPLRAPRSGPATTPAVVSSTPGMPAVVVSVTVTSAGGDAAAVPPPRSYSGQATGAGEAPARTPSAPSSSAGTAAAESPAVGARTAVGVSAAPVGLRGAAAAASVAAADDPVTTAPGTVAPGAGHGEPCMVCFDTRPTELMVVYDGCAHQICGPCMTGTFRVLSATSEVGELDCPTCRSSEPAGRGRASIDTIFELQAMARRNPVVFGTGETRPLNDEEFHRVLKLAYTRLGRVTGEEVSACAFCTYPFFAGLTSSGVLTRPVTHGGPCRKCERAICQYCGEEWTDAHAGQTCATLRERRVEEAERASMLLAQGGTFKRCPNPRCGQAISHYWGHACHHIRPGTGCPSCGTHFCYFCCRPHEGFSHTNCPSSCCDYCDCPECPDCRPGRPCPNCPGGCFVCRGMTEEARRERERTRDAHIASRRSRGLSVPQGLCTDAASLVVGPVVDPVVADPSPLPAPAPVDEFLVHPELFDFADHLPRRMPSHGSPVLAWAGHGGGGHQCPHCRERPLLAGASRGNFCDECHTRMPLGDPMLSCRACDYDRCGMCSARNVGSDLPTRCQRCRVRPLLRSISRGNHCDECRSGLRPGAAMGSCRACDYDCCEGCLRRRLAEGPPVGPRPVVPAEPARRVECPGCDRILESTRSIHHFCNDCRASIPAGAPMLSCRACDYDRCENCMRRRGSARPGPFPPSFGRMGAGGWGRPGGGGGGGGGVAAV